MKLIIQSDDFGMTEAVSCGAIKGIREGVITCTGLFSNMPASKISAEMIKPYDICLGEDINIVAGDPVSDPRDVPCLVNSEGHFLKANEHRKIDAGTPSHDALVYDQCLLEVEAQVKKFIELTGKLPAYLHGHSYGTATLGKAMHAVAQKYGVRISFDIYKKHGIELWKESWYQTPFDLQTQINTDPLKIILNDDLAPLDAEIGLLGTHCGFVDKDLFKYSSYTMIRQNDLAAVTDPRFKEWMQKHNCELIDFNDIPD